MSSLSKNKQAIAKLIWEVSTFHGLTLVGQKQGEDTAVNCTFEDIDWLRRESDRRKCLFLPVLPYAKRIQIWRQGKRATPKTTFTDARKAFEKFDLELNNLGISWDAVSVIWSHEWNQPNSQIKEPCQTAKPTPTPVAPTAVTQKKLVGGE